MRSRIRHRWMVALATVLMVLPACDVYRPRYRREVSRLLRANCSENYDTYITTDAQKKAARKFRAKVESKAYWHPTEVRNFIDWAYGKPDPRLDLYADPADKQLIRNCHRFYLMACGEDCLRHVDPIEQAAP